MQFFNKLHRYDSATAFIALSSILLSACGGGGGGNTPAPATTVASGINFDISANLVDNVVIPGYNAFSNAISNLSSAVTNYCTDVTSTSTRDAAQTEWKTTSNLWQATQSYTVGPVALTSSNLIGRIYSASPHTTGQDTFITNEVADLKAQGNAYSIPANVSNFARGLDALEFLLFPNFLTTVPSDSDQTDRCNYAKLVVAEVATNAQAIVDAWTANNNAGRSSFLTPKDSTGVTQIKAFFELVVENIDKSVKDTKLGEPAKLKNAGPCTDNTCPELVENNIAKNSYASIKANLESMKNIFTGGDGKGFDDIFIAASRQADSDAFVANIDQAIASIDAQSSSNLFDQLTTIDNPTGETNCATTADSSSTNTTPEPCAIYREVKVLSDFMKTTFATVVNLDVPGPVSGDGD